MADWSPTPPASTEWDDAAQIISGEFDGLVFDLLVFDIAYPTWAPPITTGSWS